MSIKMESPIGQEKERTFREEIARSKRGLGPEDILKDIYRNHCIPVMLNRAKTFLAHFKAHQWLLDVGCGTGYYWQGTAVGEIVLLDFAFENLLVAKTLLRGQNNVVFVQADAAHLPMKTSTISGIWSVQVTQHFPKPVLEKFIREVKRVLGQNSFHMEMYNLNPALFHRIIYRLYGKTFKKHIYSEQMEMHRLGDNELCSLWREYMDNINTEIGFSELFFHPDLRLRVPLRLYPLAFERFLAKCKALVSLFARQIHISIHRG